MEMVGLGVFILGIVLLLVGKIWFIVEGFKESVLWGVLILLVPFADLVFLVIHMNRAGKPFLLMLLAIAMMVGSFFMMPNDVVQSM